MLNVSKCAAFLAIAAIMTACGTTNRVTQNKVSETPRQVYSSTKTNASADTEFGFFPKVDQAKAKRVIQTASVNSEFEVVDVQVVVPDYLVVSEADVYLPKADIVWREDPLGDRRAQVRAIIENALEKGTAPLAGKKQVILAARVNMFHALTEKTRNSVGGKHNVQFDFVLLDAQTRQPVSSVHNVDASLKGFGGQRAYEAVRRGETQKKRITDHVAIVVFQALSTPKQS